MLFPLDLTVDQADRFRRWQAEQDDKVALRQRSDRPYYGASGGAYTYAFTPTSLGLVISVRNNLTQEEIDLTDYNDW